MKWLERNMGNQILPGKMQVVARKKREEMMRMRSTRRRSLAQKSSQEIWHHRSQKGRLKRGLRRYLFSVYTKSRYVGDMIFSAHRELNEEAGNRRRTGKSGLRGMEPQCYPQWLFCAHWRPPKLCAISHARAGTLAFFSFIIHILLYLDCFQLFVI